MGRFSVFVVLAWLALAAVVGKAEAQWSSVVIAFEGRGHRSAENATVAIIEPRVALRETRTFQDAADAASADLSTAEGIAATAQAEGVSLVVTGRMMGRNRVLVRFLDERGEELSSVEVGAPRNQSARQRFNREVTAALDQALGILDERAATARQAELREDTTEVAHLDDEIAGDDGDDAAGTARGDYPFIRGLIGIDGRSRNATFNLRSGLRRTYGAFFPQLTLAVEVRPWDASSDLAGAFATFDLAVAVGLGSNEELSSGMTVPIDTTAYRFSFAAGYLFDLETVEVGASLGFVYDAFELAPNNTIPTASYPSIRIGVLGRLPVLDDGLLGVFADGGLRIVVADGELTPRFGEGSGTIGFDVTGGLMGALDIGLAYAVRVGYVGYAVGFSGNGMPVDDSAANGYDGGVYFGAQAGWQL